jgi:guanylate kinase
MDGHKPAMAKMGMLVLVTGPAGVGKDTVINELVKLDGDLKRVQQYTDRLLRDDERGRVHADADQLAKLEGEGKIRLIVNQFGIKIGEPLFDIREAIRKGQTPIMDFNVAKVSEFRAIVGAQVFNVYISPPSMDELKHRLERAGRPERLEAGLSELSDVSSGKFSKDIDINVVNYDVGSTASSILAAVKTARSLQSYRGNL